MRNSGGCCHDHSRERPEECCHGDKCVLYSGDELVADGIEKGTDMSVVIDSLRRIIASRDKQIDLYHREVQDLKKIINELVNAGGSGGDSGTEEEVW